MKIKEINILLGVALGILTFTGIILGIDILSEPTVVVSASVKPAVTNAVVKVPVLAVKKPVAVVSVTKSVPVVKPVVKPVKKKVLVAAEYDLPGIDGNRLMAYLETAENPDGDPDLVGDKNLRHHAYGTLQIRQPYLTDVIRFSKKDMIKKYGRVLTIKDMKDRQKARWVARVYLHCYGKEYTRRTGKIPTYKIYAKIHNGGPEGWHPRNLDTRKYWAMVVRVNGLEGVG